MHRYHPSKIATVAVAGFAAATLALGGCTSDGTPITSGSSAATPTAAAALMSAVAQLKTVGFDLTVTEEGGQLTGGGSVDPGKSASLSVHGTVEGQALKMAAEEIGGDTYLKVDLGPLNAQLGVDPNQWMKIDPTKTTEPMFDAGSADSLDLGPMLTGVSNVTATDSQHLSGIIDMTKATGVNAPSADDLKTAGDAAKTVKFTATLDDQGRLTELKMDGGADSPLSQDIKITNYGSPTPVTAPTDSVPAPDSIYQLFNS